MTTVASAYHIEINPGDAGNADRYVVQEVIKEMAQYNPVGGEATRAWKVLLLSEVDRLSKEAQAALRRTMEKYTATCRLILVATSPSKVIEPLRSRCLGVRVPLPQNPELMGVLQAVAKKEGVTLPQPVAARISQAAGRNVRR
jgi:replication factor C subunit 3/5